MNIKYNFHVDFDGQAWRCYETEETSRADSPIELLPVPVFTADWDGVSLYLNETTGKVPVSGIPFMGWPQTDIPSL